MDNFAFDNKDVENGVDNVAEFIAKIWSGVEAVLDVLPDIVIGGIVIIALCLWLIRKAKNG